MNWFYWKVLRIRRRFYARDSLSLLGVLIAIVLSAQGKDPAIALPLLGAYIIFTIWRWILVLRAREARDLTMATAVGGLFHLINQQVFNNSSCTRYTLFQEVPGRSCIVPICRYRRSGKEPVKEAEASRSWYRRGEGITGKAWDGPPNEVDVQVLPHFEGKRSVMDAYYLRHLDFPRDRLEAISDHMVRVRAIISYTFADGREQQLGLMSIDIADADVRFEAEDGTMTVVPNGGTPFLVDLDHLSILNSMIGNVLESFDLAGRKISYE